MAINYAWTSAACLVREWRSDEFIRDWLREIGLESYEPVLRTTHRLDVARHLSEADLRSSASLGHRKKILVRTKRVRVSARSREERPFCARFDT